jgi:diaminopimelate epimerase
VNIPFIKMHAQGNDFILVNKEKTALTEDQYHHLAKAICDRHFGLGADGLVVLDSENQKTPRMIIYNTDGTKAEMCGSAMRCSCALLSRLTGAKEITLQTDNGKLKGMIDAENPLLITVEMGKPVLIKYSFDLESYKGDYIKIGNPHFVIIRDDADQNLHLLSGKSLSSNKAFEEGANIEFVKVISRQEISLWIWERGVGETLACGTGATAAVFAAGYRSLLDDDVKVNLPGGSVNIKKVDEIYHLKGEVTFVANGEYGWKT